ncbi:MAG TPA: dihydropteroate synthase [Arenicellales bacterium]|nr:dihydropteroate synthase [Arenicellales bacterium]
MNIPQERILECGARRLDLAARPAVMGVLNVTPDSFSDGGRFHSGDKAVDHALRMHEQGADIIDIGGESTRPGAADVSEQQELERVIPVIEAVRGRVDAVISIDTSKPRVMREAVAAGADLVNDVYALRAGGAVPAAAASGAAVCLMHMQGTPRTMQVNPSYRDVVAEVSAFLTGRIEACIHAGIPRSRLVVDPGFGFGKTFEHNLALLRGLGELCRLGVPVLAGLSRKSFVGKITGSDMDERVHGSVAFALAAMQEGASILRVHDVKATVDAVAVWQSVYGWQ